MNGGFDTLSALWSVRNDRALGASEQRVLLMLIAYSDETGFCRPSITTLAAAARLRPTTVRAALRVLEASGGPVLVAVERGRRSEKGDPDTHAFRLSPGEGYVNRERTVRQSGTEGVRSETGGGTSNGNPEEDKKKTDQEDTEEHELALASFGDWRSTLWKGPRAPSPTAERMKHIRGRLRDGFTRDQLKVIYAKVASSDFHVRGGYIEPATIIKNREKAEWWLARNPTGRGVTPQTGVVEGVDPNSWGKDAAAELTGGAP